MPETKLANYFPPSQHEAGLADRIARLSLKGDREAIMQELAQYRERLIRPIVGRATAEAEPGDNGSKSVYVLTRGDCHDIINRARR